MAGIRVELSSVEIFQMSHLPAGRARPGLSMSSIDD